MGIFCVLLDLVMAVGCFLMGYYFYRSNGKAANLLTGYNMRSDEERKQFNEPQMCKIYGKRMMLWAIPFLIGGVIDAFAPGMGIAVAWIWWIILFILFMVERSKWERKS